jgi:hypothetical protein
LNAVNLLDVFVCELLHLLLVPFEFVFGDVFVFLELAQVFVQVAADVAHGDTRFFSAFMHLLDEVFAPLFS